MCDKMNNAMREAMQDGDMDINALMAKLDSMGGGSNPLIEMLKSLSGGEFGDDLKHLYALGCDTSRAAVISLFERVLFVGPACRMINADGIEAELDGYSPAITAILEEQITAFEDAMRSGEAAIRLRAMSPKCDSTGEPIVATLDRLDQIVDRLEVYTANAACVAFVVLAQTAGEKLIDYSKIINLTAVRMRELAEVPGDAVVADQATRYIMGFSDEVMALMVDPGRAGINPDKRKELSSGSATKFAGLMNDGLTGLDAIMQVLGGQDATKDAVDRYVLNNPEDRDDAEGALKWWNTKIGGSRTFVGELEEEVQSGLFYLKCILDMAALHSDATYTETHALLTDVLKGLVGPTCEVLGLSIQRDIKAIEANRKISKDAYTATRLIWDTGIAALPKDALVTQVADTHMDAFVGIFGDIEKALHKFIEDMAGIMMNPADGQRYVIVYMGDMIAQLPEVVDSCVADMTLEECTTDEHKAAQAQFAAAVNAGTDPNHAALGALMTDVADTLAGGGAEKVEAGEESEKLEAGESTEQVEPGH